MSLVLDVIIIVIFAFAVIAGYRRGFFKSIMTLCSGIASILIAYTFTPALAAILNEKIFLSRISESIADTLASMAKTGTDAAQNAVYDLAKLLENSQFLSIIQRYGADTDNITKYINGTNDTTYNAIQGVSNTVAAPISETISNVCAFLLLFIASIVILKIITAVIGGIFKLPVLKTMDKLLGLVFGIASAFLFVWLFIILARAGLDSILTVAPGKISENAVDNTILFKFFESYNILDILKR